MEIPGDIEIHRRFMREAIKMVSLPLNQVSIGRVLNQTYVQAELALSSDETPVGCVFVHDGEIIGKGMNDTNRSMNVGTNFALLFPVLRFVNETRF